MQINAVSAKDTSFGQHYPTREELESFANADDRTLRYFASRAASDAVNDRKHRDISNALWYTLPLAGGLSELVKYGAGSRMAKFKTFGKGVASWGAALLAVDAVNYARRVAHRNSSTVREFNNEHPFLSTVVTIGAAIGGILLANKGLNKLNEKYGAKILEHVRSLNIYESVKKSKIITDIMSTVRKAPSAIKSLTKGVLEWSPVILVGTSIAHSLNHERTKAAVTANNYATLKANQQQVRQVLAVNDAIDKIKADAAGFEDIDE